MKRCVVFDSTTATAVRDAGADADFQPNATIASAIAGAAQRQRTVVLVLPAGDERVTVARITPPELISHDRSAE